MAFGSWTPFRRDPSNMPAHRGQSSNGQGLSRMQNQMNRMVQDLMGSAGSPWSMPSQFMGDFSSAQFMPRMDVCEAGDQFRICAELPGMTAEDVEIDCERNRLRIHGQKQAEQSRDEEGYYHAERTFGAFDRTIPLPEDVDVDNATANFKNGVLTIEAPRMEGAPERKKLDISVD